MANFSWNNQGPGVPLAKELSGSFKESEIQGRAQNFSKGGGHVSLVLPIWSFQHPIMSLESLENFPWKKFMHPLIFWYSRYLLWWIKTYLLRIHRYKADIFLVIILVFKLFNFFCLKLFSMWHTDHIYFKSWYLY